MSWDLNKGSIPYIIIIRVYDVGTYQSTVSANAICYFFKVLRLRTTRGWAQ